MRQSNPASAKVSTDVIKIDWMGSAYVSRSGVSLEEGCIMR